MTTQLPDMYRGDLKPDLVLNVPTDLTTAVQVRVIGVQHGTTVLDSVETGDAAGTVTHVWVAGETDTPGDLFLEVEVTWPGGKPQTFRVAEPWSIAQDFG